MNLFQSIRQSFGMSTNVTEWQPIDELQVLIDRENVARFELEKAQQEFDRIDGEYALKLQACDVLIEKGMKEDGESNKMFLTQRLDNITQSFADECRQLTEELNKAVDNRTTFESTIVAAAIETVSEYDDDQQQFVKATIDNWRKTGLINQQPVDSHAKAIVLVVEQIEKGGPGSGRKPYRFKDMAGNIKTFHADSEDDARKQAKQHFKGNKFFPHTPSEQKNELEKGGPGSGRKPGYSAKQIQAMKEKWGLTDDEIHWRAEMDRKLANAKPGNELAKLLKEYNDSDVSKKIRSKINKNISKSEEDEILEKGGKKIGVDLELKKSHEPIAIELAGKGDIEFEGSLEGHYANVIVKRTFKEGSNHIEKILFLKRAAGKIVEPNKLCLPGGHIDEGETVTKAACRELKEEANLDLQHPHIIGKIKCADGKWAFYVGGHCNFDPALLDGENTNAVWMCEDEWIAADLLFDLKDHLVAIQRINDAPTIQKGEDKEVEMPWKEFVEEHERLLDILENGTPEQRKKEAARQRKEMAKHKNEPKEKEDDEEIEKSIDDDNPFYYDDEDELIKGRAAAEGEERTWGGKKYKKVSGKWTPVSGGGGREGQQHDLSGKVSAEPDSTGKYRLQTKHLPEGAKHGDKVSFTIRQRGKPDKTHTGTLNTKQTHEEDNQFVEGGKMKFHHIELDQKKTKPLATKHLKDHAENTSTDQLKKVAEDKNHPHNDVAKRELERRSGEEGGVKEKRKLLNQFKKEIGPVLEQADFDTDNPKVQKVLDKYMEMDTNAFDSDELDAIMEKQLQKGNEKKIEHHTKMHELHSKIANDISSSYKDMKNASQDEIDLHNQHKQKAEEHKKALDKLNKNK